MKYNSKYRSPFAVAVLSSALTVAILMIALMFNGCIGSTTENLIEARKLVIRDRNGKDRIIFDTENEPKVTMTDNEGVDRIEMGLHAGVSFITLRSPDGMQFLTLSNLDSGNLAMGEKDSQTGLLISGGDTPMFGVYNAKAKERLEIGLVKQEFKIRIRNVKTGKTSEAKFQTSN